jgi:hypothetical protein
MTDRTERIHELMNGAWKGIEKGDWTEPILGIQTAFVHSFEAIQELAKDVCELSAAIHDLENKVDRGYKLAGAVRGYLGIVGATRELGDWEKELQKVLTTFEGPKGG